jgi:AcrR family transcriptional regulator
MLWSMATPTRTRLAPDARRDEILDHARQVFGGHSYAAVSASQIARAAGVTHALVVHYFPGGKREIFLALMAEFSESVPVAIHVNGGGSLRKRVDATIEQWLAWLDVNRETWLATAAQGDYIADAELQAVVDAGRDNAVATIISDYHDVLTDNHVTRQMLRNWLGFNRASSRSWLKGEATREQTALFLAETLHHLIKTVAPKLAKLGPGTHADVKAKRPRPTV